MKVRVEMEMPMGCKECPFYYPGKENDICYFPEDKHRLSAYDVSDAVRPDACPLNECTRVVDAVVKVNPPIVTDADSDKEAVIKIVGGTHCSQCIFADEDGNCGRDCGVMDGRVSGGDGWCTAGIKKEE